MPACTTACSSVTTHSHGCPWPTLKPYLPSPFFSKHPSTRLQPGVVPGSNDKIRPRVNKIKNTLGGIRGQRRTRKLHWSECDPGTGFTREKKGGLGESKTTKHQGKRLAIAHIYSCAAFASPARVSSSPVTKRRRLKHHIAHLPLPSPSQTRRSHRTPRKPSART